MNDSNPYESPQVVEAEAQDERSLLGYAGDAVPADFRLQDLLLVLGVTSFMILVALAFPYVLATVLGW